MGFLSKLWENWNKVGIYTAVETKPTKKKAKRARDKGKYKADDKSTKNYNEAWVGGKAPKKKKKK